MRPFGEGKQYEEFRSSHRPAVSLTIGEVHTGLLMTSAAVPADRTTALLAVLPGSTVQARQRPVRYASSPEVFTGVDCLTPMAGRREVRVVGTPATRVSLTDGHIVQAATYAALRRDSTGRRHPWGHYLAQPGMLEVLGTESEENLATGFLDGQAAANTLDLSAVNARAMATIQRSEELDHNPPFRSRRTRLRWSAEAADSGQDMVFTLYPDGFRTVRLRADERDPRALADFCADLALHDWLLSTLLDIVDRAVTSRRPPAELIGLLRPGIDHLVHAWMPAAHITRTLVGVWQEFDLRSGFSLQWNKTVERMRDQLSMGIIEVLRPPKNSPGSELV